MQSLDNYKHTPPIKVEICVGSLDSALAAARGGADRIELCSALSEGGLTPSIALIRRALTIPNVVTHVLVRPRMADFLYTSDECDVICEDIRAAVEAGVSGIVIGALTPHGDIDVAALRRFINAAEGASVTFHRAFDLCRHPQEALEQIIELGCNRLLTSGQAPTAETGIPLLRELIRQSQGRITIMPGGGVSPSNAARLLRDTGATELHASVRVPLPSQMIYRHAGVSMGRSDIDEYARLETSSELVAALVREVRKVREL